MHDAASLSASRYLIRYRHVHCTRSIATRRFIQPGIPSRRATAPRTTDTQTRAQLIDARHSSSSFDASYHVSAKHVIVSALNVY